MAARIGRFLNMTYNNSFQDRAGQAAEAKAKALEQYRARPQVDAKVAAERVAAGQERAEAKAQRAAGRKAERKAAAEASAAKDEARVQSCFVISDLIRDPAS